MQDEVAGATEPLGYAPAPRGLRRRWVRAAVLTVTVLAFAVPGWVFGPRVYRRAALVREQREVLRDRIAPDRVYVEPPPGKYAGEMMAGEVDLLVFRHGRRANASSPERLVIVLNNFHGRFLYSADSLDKAPPFLSATVWAPASWTEDGRLLQRSALRSDLASDVPLGSLRFYAGQPDPADESHFTIDYETPGGRGTIDGWLEADDTVHFEVRDGP